MIGRLLTQASLALAPMAIMGAAHAQTVSPLPSPSPTGSSYFTVSGGYFGEFDFDYTVSGFNNTTTVAAGYGLEAAYGARFGQNLRGEIAIGWSDHNDAESSLSGGNGGSGVSAFTLDLNAYLDTAPDQPVNVYLGAGIGVGSVTIDDFVIVDSSGDGLHLQGIAGIEVAVGPRMKVFGEARLRNLAISVEDPGGNTNDANLTRASFQAGLRFLF
jgi:opacity protein-like surface antigen